MTYYLTYSQSAYQLTLFNPDGSCYLASPELTALAATANSKVLKPATHSFASIDDRLAYLQTYHREQSTGLTFSYLGPVSSPTDFQLLYPEHFL